MLDAWRRLTRPVTLEILGDGPERAALEARAGAPGVHFRGRVSRPETLTTMKRAGFLVFPSEWVRGNADDNPRGLRMRCPAIASRLGTMAEIVADGRTGLHFTPGDADDLAAKVEWAASHPDEMTRMGHAARAEFEAKYTAKRNLSMLLSVYDRGARRSAEARAYAAAHHARTGRPARNDDFASGVNLRDCSRQPS